MYTASIMHKKTWVMGLMAMVGVGLFCTSSVFAQSIAAQVSGRIVLDVESHGEAWYVSPPTLDRYYLRDGDAAYEALRTFGLGVSDANLEKIPLGIEARFELPDADGDLLPDSIEDSLGTNDQDPDTDDDGYTDAEEASQGFNPLGSGSVALSADFAETLSGRILLQVEAHGEAWYINPADHKRYYLGNGETAYQVMRYISLGITSANLAAIPVSASSPRPPMTGTSSYESTSIATSSGTFSAKIITLRRDAFTMVTDTGDTTDCEVNCTANPLATYIEQNGAFAGIHGSYFCPPDYADCVSKTYSYNPPVFNSDAGVMLNDDKIIYYNLPMIAQTTDGDLHYFHDAAVDFADTLAEYESSTRLTVNAAIGNWPALVEEGESVVDTSALESAYLSAGTRGAIGWNDTYVFLVIASSVTTPNLADILVALDADYAMNLDGGGSAALYYDGAYKAGPGRLLPNAIVFVKK